METGKLPAYSRWEKDSAHLALISCLPNPCNVQPEELGSWDMFLRVFWNHPPGSQLERFSFIFLREEGRYVRKGEGLKQTKKCLNEGLNHG